MLEMCKNYKKSGTGKKKFLLGVKILKLRKKYESRKVISNVEEETDVKLYRNSEGRNCIRFYSY